MGGPQRHESLNDILGSFNWRKTIRIGAALKKSLQAAKTALAKHRPKFEEMSQHIPQALRDEWVDMMRAFDRDKKAPNPYKEPGAVTTLADVRLELANEEAVEAARGHLSPHETSASVFLNVGLDLEEQRCVLQAREKKLPRRAEDEDEAKDEAGRKHKRKKTILTNELLPSTAPDPSSNDAIFKVGAPEAETLFLPSQMPPEVCDAGCVPGLINKEVRLRVGQAQDALHQLRRAIRVKYGMVHYKRGHVNGPGQNANTRASAQLERLEDKLRLHVYRYRAAYDALEILDPNGSWSLQLLKLKDEHIRASRLKHNELSKGNFEVSWIWQALRANARDIPGEEATEEEVNNSVRVDWVTSKVCIDRWVEEVALIKEEMPRAVRFMRSRAEWWRSNVDSRSDLSPDTLGGLNVHVIGVGFVGVIGVV
ncbi:hypothetical protein FA95DRAFT_1573235 [Auriscalpium vulgare]|uniref:Uncharacterized protein n=1 Tax=Auriscalpium vulgare TaxID=40419 RepID=A0ACB8RR34_9AGAM|nr:hypothetical protein FA95DRAFT_1573235 [Auriscalpium vulgare]